MKQITNEEAKKAFYNAMGAQSIYECNYYGNIVENYFTQQENKTTMWKDKYNAKVKEHKEDLKKQEKKDKLIELLEKQVEYLVYISNCDRGLYESEYDEYLDILYQIDEIRLSLEEELK